MNDRLNDKLDLLVKLGALFGPLQHLADHPDDYDEQERAETIARYISEHQELIRQFGVFSQGQPGPNYQIEYERFLHAISWVKGRITGGDNLTQIIAEQLPIARDAISAVPVPRSSVILEAGSPFTAFCKLRSLCEGNAAKSICWFDPYFGPDIFHRFLQFAAPTVSIELIACEPGPHAGKKNLVRWNSFLDISRLFASERGVSGYRLLVANSLHDRWLVLDDRRVYALGGSVKDAASTDLFTIAHVDASPENMKKIRDTNSAATEWFGRATPSHR